MSFMSDAVVAAFKTARDMGGEPIQYNAQHCNEDFDITAVPGRSSVEQTYDQVATVEAETQDWLILATDISGNLPRSGDTIRTASNQVFKVLSDGSQPWRWNDQFRVVIRVHTKLFEVQ